MREAFKKSGPNPHFYKSVEKGCFLYIFDFCSFLTLFDHKISENFPHFGGRGGDLGGVKASLMIIQIVLVILLSETCDTSCLQML